MVIKASEINFARLHKTLEKVEDEHSQFRETMRAAMKQAAFPTEQMIESLERQLGQFKFSYLPYGAPLLP